MKRFIFPFFLLFLFNTPICAQHKTENVVIVTLDGMRWQEVFSGS